MTEDSELSDRTPESDIDELLRSVSSRPPSDAPYLAESTARYILNSSSGELNKAAKERDIENALTKIPLRITRLLYDLAILSRGQYLDSLDQNWRYLEQVPDFLSYATRHSHGRETASNRKSVYFNIGFDVGLGFSSLTGTISEDPRGSEFLAGFTTAFSTDHFQVSHPQSDKNTGDYSYEIEPERRDLLEEYGVEPTEYIDRLIQTHNQAWSSLGERNPLSTKEATQEFLEERVGEWFGKCSYLRKELEREWSSISEASTPGVNAGEVLNALWELECNDGSELTNSTKIAQQVGKTSNYKGSISQVLNRLSIDGKEPDDEASSTFEAKEIVQHNGREWKLTGYGQLLLYHVFTKGQDPQWVQETAIDDRLPLDEVQRHSERDSEILEQGVQHYYDG